MRPIIGFVIVLLLVVVAGRGPAARAEAPVASAPPGKLSNLRVCGSKAFSRARERCTKDERRRVLVSSRIACSLDVAVTRPALLRPRMTYEGRAIAYPPSRLTRGGGRYWIDQDLRINLPLPGGRWGCSFKLGSATVRASFTSGGPQGRIVNTAACRGENTIPYNSRFRVCRSDESAAPIQSTSSAYCYAAYPSETGRLARLAIVSDGRILYQISFAIKEPLWLGTVFASAPPGQKLPAGSYTCKYYLDGALVTEKPFELLG